MKRPFINYVVKTGGRGGWPNDYEKLLLNFKNVTQVFLTEGPSMTKNNHVDFSYLQWNLSNKSCKITPSRFEILELRTA